MIEPPDSRECKDFMIRDFEISETFGTPVLYRVSTRIYHSKSLCLENTDYQGETGVFFHRQPAEFK